MLTSKSSFWYNCVSICLARCFWLQVILTYYSSVKSKMYKGIRSSAMRPDFREPRKVAFPGLRLAGTIVATGLMETNWMIVLSSRRKFKICNFWILPLELPPFLSPSCSLLSRFLSLATLLFAICWYLHSSTPGSLILVKNPCPVSHYYKWWFLSHCFCFLPTPA